MAHGSNGGTAPGTKFETSRGSFVGTVPGLSVLFSMAKSSSPMVPVESVGEPGPLDLWGEGALAGDELDFLSG